MSYQNCFDEFLSDSKTKPTLGTSKEKIDEFDKLTLQDKKSENEVTSDEEDYLLLRYSAPKPRPPISSVKTESSPIESILASSPTESRSTKEIDIISEEEKIKENQEKFYVFDYRKSSIVSYENLFKHHKRPVYGAPFYCTPEFRCLDEKVRIKFMCDFYSQIKKNLNKLAKDTLKTERVDEILISSTSGSYNSGSTNANLENDGADLYVSQRGRLTKRPCYNQASLKIYSKSFTNLDFKSTPSRSSENVNSVKVGEITSAKEHKPDLEKKSNWGRARKKLNLSLLSDDGPSRAEKMLEAVQIKESIQSVKKQDDDFELDIQNASSGSSDDFSEVSEQRRRIVPPRKRPANSGAKKSGNQKKKQKNEAKTIIQEESDPELVFPPNNKREDTQSVSTPGEQVECPICGKQFHSDEIMNHASSCGETEEPGR